ncbi:hypothetical protein N9769_09310, partial [Ascidiaceihabitans sp.]|nr:hypothetical protein [Ascidiaceihabitans sp.]
SSQIVFRLFRNGPILPWGRFLFTPTFDSIAPRHPLHHVQRLMVCRLNTLFKHAVLTLHLEMQCLAKIANTALPNTVFALLFNKNNYIEFWKALSATDFEP